MYVSETGSDENYGFTPEQALALPKSAVVRVDELMAVLGDENASGTVYVAPGTYEDNNIILTNAISLIGTSGNPNDVVITNTGVSKYYGNGLYVYRNAMIGHPKAVISSVSLAGAHANNPHTKYTIPAIYTTTGVGVTILKAGGTITNCIVRGAKSTSDGGYGVGIGVVEGASNVLITHSIIRDCSVYGNPHWDTRVRAVGVDIRSGLMQNCLIYNNISGVPSGATYTRHIGGIHAAGSAKVVNCTVVDNNVGNVGGVGSFSGIFTADNAKVYNTIAVNGLYNAETATALTLGGKAAAYVNCATDQTELENETLIIDEPANFFKSYVVGDIDASFYMPSELLYNAGTMEIDGYTFPETDLAGKFRVQDGAVEIGTYEAPPNLTVLMIR